MLYALMIGEAEFPGKLLNANASRGHTRFLGRLAAPWRQLGKAAAIAAGIPRQAGPVRVWAEFTFPTNHRRDVANLAPTVKAVLDGVVDAGVLADDRDGVIEGPWPKRIYPNGPLTLRLVLQPIEPNELGKAVTE